MNLFKLFFFSFALLPGFVFALPGDRSKPIEIESDAAQLNNQRGVSVYTGNVVMVQGTTRLMGDKITIYNDKSKQVTQVIAEGKRAFYEELLENQRDTVKAWGEHINYSLAKKLVILTDRGELYQNGDIFKGERINYNLEKQTVIATGQPEDKNNLNKRRVQMVIHPKVSQ